MDLGQRVRELRKERGLTLQQVAAGSGLSVSAISKIENNQLSPTYDSLQRLAAGLSLSVGRLLSDEPKPAPRGRRSITRNGEGLVYRTDQYDYYLLCTDIIDRRIIPLLAEIKCRDEITFGPMAAHEGEEMIYVLSGQVELQTEYYGPTILRSGDAAYFDSTMAHRCIARGDVNARILWVCTHEIAGEVMQQIARQRTGAPTD